MGEEDSYEQGKQMIFLAFVIPIIFIVIVLVSLIFNGLAVKSFDVHDIQQSLMFNRVLYSPDCFALSEEGAVTAGMIDIKKFDSDRLGKCLDVKEKNIGIKATLEYGNAKKEAIVNELMTNRDFLCGKKSNICNEKDYYVLIKDGGKIMGGYLNILIIELK